MYLAFGPASTVSAYCSWEGRNPCLAVALDLIGRSKLRNFIPGNSNQTCIATTHHQCVQHLVGPGNPSCSSGVLMGVGGWGVGGGERQHFPMFTTDLSWSQIALVYRHSCFSCFSLWYLTWLNKFIFIIDFCKNKIYCLLFCLSLSCIHWSSHQPSYPKVSRITLLELFVEEYSII